MPEKRKGGESNGIENHTEATDENQIHLQISQQIFLGKFVEPKRRYLAQNCYFDVKVEPFWLNNEACPNGKRSVFGIVQRRNSLKLQYLRAVYSYALRGVSYGITSRDFVCQSPNQNPLQKVNLLVGGLPPPIPPEKTNERRNNVYERYTNRHACHGKRKRENTIKSPKVRAEYN